MEKNKEKDTEVAISIMYNTTINIIGTKSFFTTPQVIPQALPKLENPSVKKSKASTFSDLFNFIKDIIIP